MFSLWTRPIAGTIKRRFSLRLNAPCSIRRKSGFISKRFAHTITFNNGSTNLSPYGLKVCPNIMFINLPS